MQRFGRRQFLKVASASSLASGATGLAVPTRAAATDLRSLTSDPQGILDLPPGFSYRVLSRAGERMHDGYRVPGNPDAMGAFQVGSELVLMRNHEIAPGDRGHGPYFSGMSAPAEAFDKEAFGGVTRIVLDPRSLEVKRQELALCGTHWNCAGGLSPWGWLSCEEIFAPGHGYVFLAPHAHAGLSQARPIKPYGRFRHEAASVDPQTLIAYLSEDRDDAAFYRFVPSAAATPFQGRLQALRVVGQPRFDTSSLVVGKSVPIEWVDIPEPDPAEDSVRFQARDRGAARFARTEGLWLNDDELFVCATTGGPIGHGQILRITQRSSRPMLSVIAQSHDPMVLDMPDNITVSPHGELVIAEDGLEGNYLRRVTRDGVIADFARNALSSSELTGPCFAPDGQTLFVNLQRDGLTLAIRGPFEEELQRAPAAKGDSDTRAAGPGFASVTAGLVTLSLAALMQRRRKLGAAG